MVRPAVDRASVRIQSGLVVFALIVLSLFFRLNPELPTDLDPRLIGTVAVLQGQDPYAKEVTERIQVRMYGHPLSQYDIEHHHDQHRFAYPLYVAFFLAPLTRLRFDSANYLACGIFAIATALSVPLWLRAMGWRVSAGVLAVLVSGILLSPIATRGLWLNQLGLLVMFLLALAAIAVKRGRLFVAGVILAVATIKPQLAVLPIAWFSLWSFSDIRRRWQLLAGMALMLLLLLVGSELLMPGWTSEFVSGLRAYSRYTGAPSAFQAVLGRWSMIPAVLVLAAFFQAAWRARCEEPSGARYALALALACAATAWAMPANWDPFNQLMSLPAIFVLGRHFQNKHQRDASRHARAAG